MAELAGLKFTGIDRKHVLNDQCSHCENIIKRNGIRFVITANAEYIVRAQTETRLRNLISTKITTFDGTVPYWMAMLLNPKTRIEKISGSDLIYDVAKLASTQGKKLFLLGGHSDSNLLAIKKLQDLYPGLEVGGYSPPPANYPFPDHLRQTINRELNDFRPDFLFVAFGTLKQEYWIEDHLPLLESLGVDFVVGCGGTFDFVSGRIARAPRSIQLIGLEGIWRFIKEPKWFRLKRLLVSVLIFYYSFFSKRK